MKLVEAHQQLLRLEQALFHTNDVAAYFRISTPHANKILSRLVDAGHIVKIAWGIWAFPERVDPLSLPEYLTAPQPSYISLQSALYFHGMISQIPTVIYAVSTARTRRYPTPLGTISIHHIQPSFFFAFKVQEPHAIKMASPEKALLDLLYLSPTKTKLFSTLPELEFPKNFNLKKAHAIIKKIDSKQRRTLVRNRFSTLVKTE